MKPRIHVITLAVVSADADLNRVESAGSAMLGTASRTA
jgi:hypothetical protein